METQNWGDFLLTLKNNQKAKMYYYEKGERSMNNNKWMLNYAYGDHIYGHANSVSATKTKPTKDPMKIKKVIFSDPCTIVIWEDGEKTIVRTHDGDVFDKEKGLAMAIAKRALGNTSKYYNTIKKYI